MTPLKAEDFYKQHLAYDDDIELKNECPLTHGGAIHLMEVYASQVLEYAVENANVQRTFKNGSTYTAYMATTDEGETFKVDKQSILKIKDEL